MHWELASNRQLIDELFDENLSANDLHDVWEECKRRGLDPGAIKDMYFEGCRKVVEEIKQKFENWRYSMATEAQVLEGLSARNKDLANEILESIVHEAAYYFEKCPQDFCVQTAHGDGIIFGGTNRLIWRIRTGFRIDRSYCTPTFIAHAEEI